MEILEGIRGGSDRLPTPECSRYRLNRRSLLITERPGKRAPKPGWENIGLNGTSDASPVAAGQYCPRSFLFLTQGVFS